MYTPTLTNVQSTNGKNKGGICYFEFCPKEWLQSDIVINPLQRKVITVVHLLPGKFLLKATCLTESMAFTENQKENKAGTYFEQRLVGVVNKDELDKNLLTDTLRFHELLVIYYDKNDKKKIIGTKQLAMSVIINLEVEPATAGKSFYTLELSHQTEHRAPFYEV